MATPKNFHDMLDGPKDVECLRCHIAFDESDEGHKHVAFVRLVLIDCAIVWALCADCLDSFQAWVGPLTVEDITNAQ